MVAFIQAARFFAIRKSAIVFFCFLLAGCQAVPITGRSQLNVFSDKEILSMGEQNFSSFMALANKDKRVLNASESTQAANALANVRRVSDRIVDAAGLRNQYNWETVVIKSKEANAFVLPNGKIVVFTGILSVAKSEAGLAAVLGHEVGHVVARHGAERVSQVLMTQAVTQAADVALAARNSKYRASIGAALGLGAQFGMLLPFSREHESEADQIGLFYMAKAGYDPSEAIGLWERMEAAGGAGPWQFLSSHPSPSTRRDQIRQWLPEARLFYADRTRPLPVNLAELQKARAVQSTKMAFAPQAPRPDFTPGFWYQVKSSNLSAPVTYTYRSQEKCGPNNCLKIEGSNGAANLYTEDFGLVETRSASGNWTRFSPPLQMTRWPLKVGESWSDSITLEQSTGQKAVRQLKMDVVDYESVVVPGGEFQAYKIIAAINGVRFREIWYAPETKTFVKTISYDSAGKATTSELIDFRRDGGLGDGAN